MTAYDDVPIDDVCEYCGELQIDCHCCDSATRKRRYARSPQHDKRIGNGDDFAGDAWWDRKRNELKYVAVGRNPNMPSNKHYPER